MIIPERETIARETKDIFTRLRRLKNHTIPSLRKLIIEDIPARNVSWSTLPSEMMQNLREDIQTGRSRWSPTELSKSEQFPQAQISDELPESVAVESWVFPQIPQPQETKKNEEIPQEEQPPPVEPEAMENPQPPESGLSQETAQSPPSSPPPINNPPELDQPRLPEYSIFSPSRELIQEPMEGALIPLRIGSRTPEGKRVERLIRKNRRENKGTEAVSVTSHEEKRVWYMPWRKKESPVIKNYVLLNEPFIVPNSSTKDVIAYAPEQPRGRTRFFVLAPLLLASALAGGAIVHFAEGANSPLPKVGPSPTSDIIPHSTIIDIEGGSSVALSSQEVAYEFQKPDPEVAPSNLSSFTGKLDALTMQLKWFHDSGQRRVFNPHSVSDLTELKQFKVSDPKRYTAYESQLMKSIISDTIEYNHITDPLKTPFITRFTQSGQIDLLIRHFSDPACTHQSERGCPFLKVIVPEDAAGDLSNPNNGGYIANIPQLNSSRINKNARYGL